MSSDERARSANIFDVARLAGVSHQTVSRVLNDLPNVRPATRERVEQAIRQLRYVPSPAARALVSRRSRVLGFITTSGSDFGTSTVTQHFTAAARSARYSVITSNLVDADAAAVREAVELLLRQNVEAIVLVAATRADQQSLAGMELGVPLVMIGAGSVDGAHRVAVHQAVGAREAVEHLVGLGHREIRHIAGPAGSADAAERERGWREALAAHRLPAVEPIRGDWTPGSGFAAAQRLLADDGGFTAVFAAGDQLALGAIHALVAAGRSVPGEVSVVGFDDIPESEHLLPPLTTVRLDFVALGRDALDLVIALLDDDDQTGDAIVRRPALIVRESTRRLA